MAHYVRIAAKDDLAPGERRVIEIDGLFIALFRVGDQYFAIEDVCTHDDGPLAEGDLEDHEIVCPRHGARFDIRTGKALSFPAIVDVARFEVRVDGEDVLVDIESG